MPVEKQPSSSLVPFEEVEVNPAPSGWYDLVTPPLCQGSLALEDKQEQRWFCTGCLGTFRTKHEATRHINTAGMEVRCRYCDGVVNGVTYSLRRHIETGLCKRRGEERGFTGERTVDGAFRA